VAQTTLPEPLPPPELLEEGDVVLRLLRVIGPEDAETRAPEARFLAAAPECRFAIHRRDDGARVGRIHLRLTDDPAILRSMGHCGYAIDPEHRGRRYASQALQAIRRLAAHYGVAPLWALIGPANVASRRSAERAGFVLVDTVAATPEALALELEPELCRYVAEDP
jgi:predicted acetyltransferase